MESGEGEGEGAEGEDGSPRTARERITCRVLCPARRCADIVRLPRDGRTDGRTDRRTKTGRRERETRWDIACRKGREVRKADDAGPLGDVYFRAAPLARARAVPPRGSSCRLGFFGAGAAGPLPLSLSPSPPPPLLRISRRHRPFQYQ